MEEHLIEECKSVFAPLRVAFEHGAKVASMEKSYTAEEKCVLPTTSAAHFGTDEPCILPDPASIEIPAWLTETLEKYSSNGVVRAWTRELTDRFGVDGDKTIADTFLDMPYMSHHPYAAAILQLAFLPDEVSSDYLLEVVKYPRGPSKSPLVAALWDRMVVQLSKTCDNMGLDKRVARQAVEQLTSYRGFFRKGSIKFVGGVNAPHALKKNIIQRAEFDVSAMQKSKLKKENSSSSFTKSVSSSQTSGSSWSVDTSKPKKRVWRRLFGWSNKAH